MNEEIIKQLALDLQIKEIQILNVLKLLEEDNTIAFIARYRKEVTGNLDEEKIKAIKEKYDYSVNLLKSISWYFLSFSWFNFLSS